MKNYKTANAGPRACLKTTRSPAILWFPRVPKKPESVSTRLRALFSLWSMWLKIPKDVLAGAATWSVIQSCGSRGVHPVQFRGQFVTASCRVVTAFVTGSPMLKSLTINICDGVTAPDPWTPRPCRSTALPAFPYFVVYSAFPCAFRPAFLWIQGRNIALNRIFSHLIRPFRTILKHFFIVRLDRLDGAGWGNGMVCQPNTGNNLKMPNITLLSFLNTEGSSLSLQRLSSFPKIVDFINVYGPQMALFVLRT